jgi:hypothetical protein
MELYSEEDEYELYDYVEELEEESDDELLDSNIYIGTIFNPDESTLHDLVLSTRIHTEIFFKFPFPLVNKYACPHSDELYLTNRVEIVKLRIVDDCYFVIIKTFWLREFQRKLKKIYNRRKEWIESIRRNPGKYVDMIQRTGSFVERH